jgi:REP element-mobilizing transposase RayT
MGRPLRIEYPNSFYHVTSRGNERKAIFRTEKDYGRFMGYFESATERYGAEIHCFCLMPNHYHLLVETPEANLHAIVHHLNTSYTNYFNKRMGRVGHLFQGRYKAILVEKDSYALELSRYIHLNPVRARLAADPSDYPRSSFRSYVEEGSRWVWLQTEFILGEVGWRGKRSRRKYWEYVNDAMKGPIKDPMRELVAGTVLGSEGFVEWVREKWIGKKEPDRDVPALKVLRVRPGVPGIREEVERILGKGTPESRSVAIYLAHRMSGLSLRQIGEQFGGIGPSGVSENTRRVEGRLQKEKQLFQKVEEIKKTLSE